MSSFRNDSAGQNVENVSQPSVAITEKMSFSIQHKRFSYPSNKNIEKGVDLKTMKIYNQANKLAIKNYINDAL